VKTVAQAPTLIKLILLACATWVGSLLVYLTGIMITAASLEASTNIHSQHGNAHSDRGRATDGMYFHRVRLLPVARLRTGWSAVRLYGRIRAAAARHMRSSDHHLAADVKR